MINKINNYLHSEITEQILKAYFKVYNKLGYGFLEKVYENAMMIELKRLDLLCEKQKSLNVSYDGLIIGVISIDDDHKKLLDIINEFSEAIDKNTSTEEFEKLFDEFRKIL